VGQQAKAVGQLWGELKPEEKQKYQLLAAEERERVSKEIKEMEEAGLLPDLQMGGTSSSSISATAVDSLTLPIARLRKIAKLDPEVRGISKEAMTLLTYTAELFTKKLGLESNRIAQIQNRRKLLPEDVAEACSTREQFIFLKEDIRDLQRDLLHQKAETKQLKQAEARQEEKESSESKPITSYFQKAS